MKLQGTIETVPLIATVTEPGKETGTPKSVPVTHIIPPIDILL